MLNPARAKSRIVASCRDPLGIPSLSFMRGDLVCACEWVSSDRLEEAGALAGVTDIAVTQPLHLQQHRVIVAVGEHLNDLQAVAGGFALHPQRVASAAEEGGEAGLLGQRERF